MAEADEKVIAPPPAAQRQQQYAEPEDRRPPYFSESEPVACRGQSYPLTATFAPEGRFIPHGPNWQYVVNLDVPPLPAREWIKARVARMAPADRPDRVTDAAKLIAPEMWEALRRGQVDACWTWTTIKKELVGLELYPRRRPPRRPR